ncbi:hypothetical protein ACFL35_06475 [Candidatus Riflebacteria bacterium]
MKPLNLFLLLLMSFTVFAGTACLPMLVAVRNGNNNNSSPSGTHIPGMSTIAGKISLPASTASALASIHADVSSFTGFTASLSENGVIRQKVGVDKNGNFYFYNVLPKSGYKIRVLSNRIECLYYIERAFLPGQTFTFSIDTTSTARALVFEYLTSSVPSLAISQISGAAVAQVVTAIETALSSTRNVEYTHTGQTVLSQHPVTQAILAVATEVKKQLPAATTTTSSSTTTTTSSSG